MSEQIKISQLPELAAMTDAAIVPVVADAATQQISGADLKTYFTGNVTFVGANVSTLSTLNIDNRASGNTADINLLAADDITIQARDRTAGSGSEGGDINILAGDSAEDGNTTGGDVIIEAGNGGAANVGLGGSGGFIRIQTGQGGDASTQVDGENASNGGELTLRAGDAGSNNGNIDRGATGGTVRIESGDSTGNLIAGGDIVLATGTGGTDAGAGAVLIDIPSSDQGPGGEWLFGSTGNSLSVPQNAEIFGFGAGNITVGTFGNAIIRTVSIGPVSHDWIFDDTGMLTLPGEGILQSIDDTVTLRSINTGTGNANGVYVGTSGGLGFFDQSVSGNWLEIFRNNTDPQMGTTGNLLITTDNTNTAPTWTFGADGDLTAPGNVTANNLTTKFTGSWSVPTGNSTQSFTVDGNHTYQMWVEGNIPNGIIAWNALVTVTNTNVPVLGQQFAWNYEGGGNVLMFNSIPNQIIGTAGAISNVEPAVSNTNTFSFGINNASGNTITVDYGWVKLS